MREVRANMLGILRKVVPYIWHPSCYSWWQP